MKNLRVAVLVDLSREPSAGGHVKYWERMAYAAMRADLPIDLTIYYSGKKPDEALSSKVRFRYLPPVFSTTRLKFLPYVPSHTDLASFHPALAQELPGYDIIHATDGFFNFTQTAERIAQWNKIPLVTSFHTDTPAYTEVFTRQTLEYLLGKKFGGFIARRFKIPAYERANKERRLKAHLKNCDAILAMRDEDIVMTENTVGKQKLRPMRLGLDKELFTPDRADRSGIEGEYNIQPGKFIVLFVGRVDAGKNMPILMQACAEAIKSGVNLHLIVAGLGPLSDDVKDLLGDDVTLAGWVEPQPLARLYASVDCLAIASDIEIGGMIGLEALASGCPVLVSHASRVAQICGSPQAMHMVESTVPAWVEALRHMAADKQLQKTMRSAALDFRHHSLAGWGDVLQQDFLPVWQSVARKEI